MGQPIPERAWIEIDDAEWEKATPEERRHILRGALDKGRDERFRDKWRAIWQIIAAIAAGSALLVAFL